MTHSAVCGGVPLLLNSLINMCGQASPVAALSGLNQAPPAEEEKMIPRCLSVLPHNVVRIDNSFFAQGLGILEDFF